MNVPEQVSKLCQDLPPDKQEEVLARLSEKGPITLT